MNTRRSRLTIVSSVLLYMLIQPVQANPNHLEPIPPYDPMDAGYGQAVFTSLIGANWVSLWMIERPSFSREYAVILYQGGDEYEPNDAHPSPRREVKPSRWFLEHVTPKEMIWKGVPIGPDGKLLAIKPTEDVERHRTRITDDFAKAIQEAWLSTLQLTRYAEDRRRGLDGTTFQFYCGGLFGETHSPGRGPGLAAMLADLGSKLGAIALSDEKNKEPLLKEADALARKIAKEAEAEQIKLFGKKLSHITWSSWLNRNDRASQTGEAR